MNNLLWIYCNISFAKLSISPNIGKIKCVIWTRHCIRASFVHFMDSYNKKLFGLYWGVILFKKMYFLFLQKEQKVHFKPNNMKMSLNEHNIF